MEWKKTHKKKSEIGAFSFLVVFCKKASFWVGRAAAGKQRERLREQGKITFADSSAEARNYSLLSTAEPFISLRTVSLSICANTLHGKDKEKWIKWNSLQEFWKYEMNKASLSYITRLREDTRACIFIFSISNTMTILRPFFLNVRALFLFLFPPR